MNESTKFAQTKLMKIIQMEAEMEEQLMANNLKSELTADNILETFSQANTPMLQGQTFHDLAHR